MNLSIDLEKRITDNPDTLLAIANQNIEINDWLAAWTTLNGIIYEFPQYGPAYNHKGWLCHKILNEGEEARKYFELALKYDPEYHPTYSNYISLLNKLNELQELENLIKKALLVKGIDKVNIYNELGLLQEKTQKFDAAINSYLEAIKYSLQNDEISILNDSVNRCTSKINVLSPL